MKRCGDEKSYCGVFLSGDAKAEERAVMSLEKRKRWTK